MMLKFRFSYLKLLQVGDGEVAADLLAVTVSPRRASFFHSVDIVDGSRIDCRQIIEALKDQRPKNDKELMPDYNEQAAAEYLKKRWQTNFKYRVISYS